MPIKFKMGTETKVPVVHVLSPSCDSECTITVVVFFSQQV